MALLQGNEAAQACATWARDGPIDASLLGKVLRRALRGGGDFADCFLEHRQTLTVRLESGRCQGIQAGVEEGAGVRVCGTPTTSYAYTDRVTRAGLMGAAEAAGAAYDHGAGARVPADLREHSFEPQPVSRSPLDVDLAHKVALLREADEAARAAAPQIRQVALTYVEVIQTVVIAGSDGSLARDHRTRVRGMVRVVAARGDAVQRAFAAPGATAGWEFFDEGRLTRTAIETARTAQRLLEAEPAPLGRMPVVVGTDFGGVLFHEASGHGLEADAIARRASPFVGKLGERVASPLVTAVDDATVPGAWGSMGVDDEGVRARRTVLIQDGVLQSYLYDRMGALSAGRAPTGNGRRESYLYLPIPRMTNTFITAGRATVEAIIGDTRRGLYARKLGSGQANPLTGEFSFAVAEGYLIEGGRVTRPVRGAMLTGSGPQALMQIDAIADDLALTPGSCTKDGQRLPVGLGQPHLRIASLTVGGTEAG